LVKSCHQQQRLFSSSARFPLNTSKTPAYYQKHQSYDISNNVGANKNSHPIDGKTFYFPGGNGTFAAAAVGKSNFGAGPIYIHSQPGVSSCFCMAAGWMVLMMLLFVFRAEREIRIMQ